MENSRVEVRGLVTARVYGPDGVLKAESIHHNLVTAQGDGLIADMFLTPPTKNRVDNAHGYIVVGTGYASVTTPKQQTWVYTQTGTPQSMATGYPQLQAIFPNAALTYSVTFPAGSLNASNINEAALTNGAVSGTAQCLAYAQISPAVNVTSADTLALTWTITFLGS